MASNDPAENSADSDEWGVGRVLIVDANVHHAELLRSILASLSAAVVMAVTSDDALRVAAETRLDLAIIDMGFADAIGLVFEVKALTDAAIIVVSGQRPEVPVADALDAGADDYVVAPVLPAELRARARAVTRRRRHQREQWI